MSNIAVYTAVAGGYETALRKFPYVRGVDRIAFVDNWYDVDGNGWELVPMSFEHPVPRMRAKFYKVNASAVLRDHERSVWVDASVSVHDGPGLVEAMSGSELTMFRHPERDCIYAEALASLDMPKYRDQRILEQVAAYRVAGHPSHWGLWAGTIIGRTHDNATDELAKLWWWHIGHWTYQDQLSLPVVLRHLDALPADAEGDLYDHDLFTVHFQPGAA